MFDNPGKELQRLQEQLLGSEQPVQEERFEPEPEFPQPEETEEPPVRVERVRRNPEQRHIGGLVALLLMEIAALLGVAAWWLLWR